MVWQKDSKVKNLWYASDDINRCEIVEVPVGSSTIYTYEIYIKNKLLITGKSNTLEEAKEGCSKTYETLIKNLINFVRATN